MGAGFNYPHNSELSYGNIHFDATDLWVPLALTAKQRADRGVAADPVGGCYCYTLARLRKGISATQAEAELNGILRPLEPLHTGFKQGWYAYVKPFMETLDGSARPLILLLMGSVVFVLLIACGNAANLLLARSASRMHELGVRATLGAGRDRLIRQMLTESLLLGVGGGLAGIGLAWVFLRVLLHARSRRHSSSSRSFIEWQGSRLYSCHNVADEYFDRNSASPFGLSRQPDRVSQVWRADGSERKPQSPSQRPSYGRGCDCRGLARRGRPSCEELHQAPTGAGRLFFDHTFDEDRTPGNLWQAGTAPRFLSDASLTD